MAGSRALAPIEPVVLLGSTGWLADELSGREISHLVLPFPSPRALPARLFGLGTFAARVKQELQFRGIEPAAVVANDHQECPLAVAVAAACGGIPVLGILRSVGMDERDFQKYGCGKCRELLCVGEALREKVRQWSGREPGLFEEGFGDKEFHPARARPQTFPARVLVIGTDEPGKGFGDFIEAVDLIESEHPEFPVLRCDFTGLGPTGGDELLGRKRRAVFRFLGRVEDLGTRLTEYPLVVHPSRAETFGLAPLEALLAGTPTLASATGMFAKLDFLERWRFSPGEPREIAAALVRTWRTWPNCFLNLNEIQENLRGLFHIDRTVQSVKRALSGCGVK